MTEPDRLAATERDAKPSTPELARGGARVSVMIGLCCLAFAMVPTFGPRGPDRDLGELYGSTLTGTVAAVGFALGLRAVRREWNDDGAWFGCLLNGGLVVFEMVCIAARW